MSKIISTRVDDDLKEKFESECEEQNVAPADVVRTLIKSFADGEVRFVPETVEFTNED